MFQQHPDILRVMVEQRHEELRGHAQDLRFHRLVRRQRRKRRPG